MPNISWAVILPILATYFVFFHIGPWLGQNADIAFKIGRFFASVFNAVGWTFDTIIWAVSSLFWAFFSYRAAGWWCFFGTVMLSQPWNSNSPYLVKFLLAFALPEGSWFTFRPRSPTVIGQRITAARLRLHGWDDIRRKRDATIDALNSMNDDFYDQDPTVRNALTFWHSMEGIPDYIDDQGTREFQWRERLHVQIKPVMFRALNRITSAIDREIYSRLPAMYTPDDGNAPAFDIHVGLMVTNSLIHEIIEPALAVALVEIDDKLHSIEHSQKIEMRHFLDRILHPAVEQMVDAVVRDVPKSFKNAGEHASEPSAQHLSTPDRSASNSKTKPRASSPAMFPSSSPLPPNRKPRAEKDEFGSTSAGPMPGGTSLGGNGGGQKSAA
ncbi:hypothetical protein CYLTODRAFT_494775 [Cylindrobasidium torrendii FP15055 ss-10]|uniref:Uncharacterized protein n=1 Tax=Cylindrobasidium torrendii FP15055 ss-10 TaxID=1314674 RepID=A0A0D7AWM4_9AGAR|nr:hypothetical protein CYLTODRAFT_494775 [Cylindrobasidium torrendii FP15055 ss-10]